MSDIVHRLEDIGGISVVRNRLVECEAGLLHDAKNEIKRNRVKIYHLEEKLKFNVKKGSDDV